MFYNDYAGKLHINLTKGLHVLNGEQVEGYLRFRKDGLGDIGRTSRQQWFVKAVLEKIQSASSIAKIPEVLNIASTHVKTNLSLYEMSHLVAALRNIDMNDVEFATLPGAPSKKGYISYWILDAEKTQDVINRMVYRDTQSQNNKKLVAGIMYAFDKEEEAMKINECIINHMKEVVSFDLVEFNPLRDQERKTEQIAINLVAQIIKAVEKNPNVIINAYERRKKEKLVFLFFL